MRPLILALGSGAAFFAYMLGRIENAAESAVQFSTSAALCGTAVMVCFCAMLVAAFEGRGK